LQHRQACTEELTVVPYGAHFSFKNEFQFSQLDGDLAVCGVDIHVNMFFIGFVECRICVVADRYCPVTAKQVSV